MASSPPAAATGAIAAPTYADLVDLVLAAPVIADVTVRSAARIKGAEAAGVAPGLIRFYVTADLVALVRGVDGLPPRVGFLVDVAADARGRAPKLAKTRMLVFARGVPGAGDQLQLVASDAQAPYATETDARIRRIAAEVVASDAPPRVVGIGNAFHVAGTLPGEGETQIFLRTADGRPISLSVLRRPGEQPRWAVALSEIVDEAAAPPAHETLLWYRLACGMPRTLPGAATASLTPDDLAAAAADYRLVLDQLGPCERHRSPTVTIGATGNAGLSDVVGSGPT